MIKEKLEVLGFDNVREIKVSAITFEPSLLELCKQNFCGNYGKCYTCPPLLGDVEELIEQATAYEKALIFQKIYRIEDSFDIEGMTAGKKDFNAITQKVNDLRKDLPFDTLLLGAGGCHLCDRCGAYDNIPCRFPEKVIAPLEGYSINVSKLAAACGLNYINGQNTVTYFGGLFY